MKALARLLAIVLLISWPSVGLRASEPEEITTPPNGDYIIVALRRASNVAGTVDADQNVFQIGEAVSFGASLSWLDNQTCNEWRAEAGANTDFILEDPNLSDLTIARLQPPEQPLAYAHPLRLLCDGEYLADVLQIDRRVIVVPSPAGTMNAILEKPLNTQQIALLQAKLKELGLYSGDLTGKMNRGTRTSVSRYAQFRGAEYVFHSAAITESLLDGLGLLEEIVSP